MAPFKFLVLAVIISCFFCSGATGDNLDKRVDSFVKFEEVPNGLSQKDLDFFEYSINEIAAKNKFDKVRDKLSVSIRITEMTKDAYAENFDYYLKNNELHITGNNPLSCKDALNHYLFKLGLRVYLPTDKWTYFPTISDWTVPDLQSEKPLYRNRMIFSSYGTELNKAYEGNYSDFESWMNWMDQNNMSSYDFKVGGHYGIKFNIKNKNKLIACDSCRPELNGKRQAYSSTMKLCYSEKANMDMMVSDVINRYRENIAKKLPNPNYINIDPSDGGGFCTCERCSSKGSVSNSVFNFVNEVAKGASKIEPNIIISHFAYSEFSERPDFNLEENVHVYYANFGKKLELQNQLKNWESTGSLKGIRLYYGNVLDNSGNTFSDVFGDFEIFKRYDLEGYKIESSYGGLNNGLVQYLITRLVWDNDFTVEKFLEEISQNLFSSQPEKFKELLSNINQIGGDKARLIYTKGLLESLLGENLEDSELLLLNDLKIYLGYLKILDESHNDIRWQKRIINYVWSYPESSYLFNRMALAKSINHQMNKKDTDSWLFKTIIKPKIPYNKVTENNFSEYESIEKLTIQQKTNLNRSNTVGNAQFDFSSAPNTKNILTPASTIKFRKTVTGNIFISNNDASIVFEKIDSKNPQNAKWGELRFYDINDHLVTIFQIDSGNRNLNLKDLKDSWYRFEFFGIPETFVMTTSNNNVVLYKTPVRKFIGPTETYFFLKPEGLVSVFIAIPNDCRVFSVSNNQDQIIFELPKGQKESFTATIPTSIEEQILKINTKRSTFSILNDLDYVATSPEFFKAIKIRYE